MSFEKGSKMVKSDLTSRKRFEDVLLVNIFFYARYKQHNIFFKVHWNNNITFVVIDKDTCI